MPTMEYVGVPIVFGERTYFFVNLTGKVINFLGTELPRQGLVSHTYQVESVEHVLPIKHVVDFKTRRLPGQKENTIYIVDPEVAQLITNRPDVFSLNPLLHVVEETDTLAYGSLFSFYNGSLPIGPEEPWI